MNERRFYTPKSSIAGSLFAVALIGALVIDIAHMAVSSIADGSVNRHDIIFVLVTTAFAAVMLFMAHVHIKAIRYKGPCLVASEDGIELLPEQRFIQWRQMRLAEIIGHKLYIYLKADAPPESPPMVILEARDYGNLTAILSCVQQGMSEARLPPPA